MKKERKKKERPLDGPIVLQAGWLDETKSSWDEIIKQTSADFSNAWNLQRQKTLNSSISRMGLFSVKHLVKETN